MCVRPPGDGAGYEALALRIHLRLDLLAHRATQHVGLAQRIARQDLRDLHHLLLIDDDPEGLLQHHLELGVNVVGRLLAELHRAIFRDIGHRAGAVERDEGDDVLEAVGAHLDQRLAHAGRFKLEHADSLAAPEHLKGLLVVERDPLHIDVGPAVGEQLHGGGERRQGLQAEEVELHEASRLDPFHVELRRRHVGFRVAVERHQLVERPIADDDPGGVGRRVGVQTLQRLRDIEQARHLRLRVGRLLQARLVGDGLLQRHGLGRVLRHQLGELVDLAERHLQHAAHVAQDAARQERAEGDDLRPPCRRP